MKYELSIELNLPLNDVADAFADPNQLADWQRGFVSIEHVEGEMGKEGAKSEIKYLMGKRAVDMVETITKNDLPSSFSAIYQAKGVWNLQENTFSEISETNTRWTSRSEFVIIPLSCFVADFINAKLLSLLVHLFNLMLIRLYDKKLPYDMGRSRLEFLLPVNNPLGACKHFF